MEAAAPPSADDGATFASLFSSSAGSLLQRREAEVPDRDELADHASDVLRLGIRLAVPDERDARRGGHDLLVDRAPRLRAARLILDLRRVLHCGVDLRVVQLWPVGVVLRDDGLALERVLQHRLRVVEVPEPPDVRADLGLLRRNAADQQHLLVRNRLDARLEAEATQLVRRDGAHGLARIGVVTRQRDVAVWAA